MHVCWEISKDVAYHVCFGDVVQTVRRVLSSGVRQIVPHRMGDIELQTQLGDLTLANAGLHAVWVVQV